MPDERKTNAEEKAEKRKESEKLDDELEDSFPASDPPSTTAPGKGETGALDIRDKMPNRKN